MRVLFQRFWSISSLETASNQSSWANIRVRPGKEDSVTEFSDWLNILNSVTRSSNASIDSNTTRMNIYRVPRKSAMSVLKTFRRLFDCSSMKLCTTTRFTHAPNVTKASSVNIDWNITNWITITRLMSVRSAQKGSKIFFNFSTVSKNAFDF